MKRCNFQPNMVNVIKFMSAVHNRHTNLPSTHRYSSCGYFKEKQSLLVQNSSLQTYEQAQTRFGMNLDPDEWGWKWIAWDSDPICTTIPQAASDFWSLLHAHAKEHDNNTNKFMKIYFNFSDEADKNRTLSETPDCASTQEEVETLEPGRTIEEEKKLKNIHMYVTNRFVLASIAHALECI